MVLHRRLVFQAVFQAPVSFSSISAKGEIV